LALGRGSIWKRLGKLALALFLVVVFFLPVLSVVFPPIIPFDPSLPASILWTIAFAIFFSGLGAVLLGQNPNWSRLTIQFRIWEMFVGTAAIGVAFVVVKFRLDAASLSPSNWKSIYFIFVHTSLLGLAAAAIGITLLAQPGRPAMVLRWIAVLITLAVPFLSYIADVILRLYLFPNAAMTLFYWANLAIVWLVVWVYQVTLEKGDQYIFEVDDPLQNEEPTRSSD